MRIQFEGRARSRKTDFYNFRAQIKYIHLLENQFRL